MAPRLRTDCEGFHRRDFLRIGTAGLFGLSLPQFLRLEARAEAARRAGGEVPGRRADAVILVWLGGGPAAIDMWDLKPGAPEGIRGEFKPIATRVPGVQISEHLPRMAQAADKVTVVRSLAHTIPSHGPATVFMTTGNRPTPALQYPALGSLVSNPPSRRTLVFETGAFTIRLAEPDPDEERLPSRKDRSACGRMMASSTGRLAELVPSRSTRRLP